MFLSYAREDADAARRIADALRGFGVEVWFDQSELRGGDAWDAKIKKQIRECALFIAVISTRTQQRGEGYFRREWKLAVERTHDMHEGVPFLVPVVVDDTSEADALVPEQFMRVHWTRLEQGVPSPQFVEHIRQLLGGNVTPVAKRRSDLEAAYPRPAAVGALPLRHAQGPEPVEGLDDARGRPQRTHQQNKSGRNGWTVGAAVAIVVGVGTALLVSHQSPSPEVTKPATPATLPAPAPAQPPLDFAPAKSIAVLPFENMSADKDNAYFCDGVQEDILTNLGNIRELRVVSRTSVMQYRNATKPIREIARELGVAYILEGSVQRAGNKVRVTGQLIQADKDEHVWARSFDRDLTDVFAIQADLSQEIATALKTVLSPEEKKAISSRPTDNPVAYDDYLKGRALRNNSPAVSVNALRQVEVYFKSAVRQDPKFAAAWGQLAIVHALFSFWGLDASPERLAAADAAIAQAERLAPDDPNVIEAIGAYAYFAHRDYARATEEFHKLAVLRPNDAAVYCWLGLIQRRQGRWAESLDNIRRAVELDPANILYLRNLIASLKQGRRWEDLRAAHERLIAIAPEKLREQLDAADAEFGATGSTAAEDRLLARLTPEQRETPVAIYFRKWWALHHGDFAEFKRLDRIQPAFADEQPPEVTAVAAGAVDRATHDPGLHARIADSLAELQARVKREPGNVQAWAYQALLEALAGNKDEANKLAQHAVDLMPESRDAFDGPGYRYVTAAVAALTGDQDRAIAELAHLLSVPSSASVAFIRTNPSFASLRGDPRFEALLNDPKNNAPLF